MVKKILTIILFILLLGGGIGIYVLYQQSKNLNPNQDSGGIASFFPFLDNSKNKNTNDRPVIDIPVVDTSTPARLDPAGGGEKLVQITKDEVAGLTFITKDRPVATTSEPVFSKVVDFSNYKTMSEGDSGDEVTDLIRTLGEYYSDTSLATTTSFDDRLKEVVIKFQTEQKLGNDGIVGRKTRLALNKIQEDSEPKIEKVLSLRYIKRKDGSITDTYLDTFKSELASNTVIISVYEALFANNGSTVILRYLKPDHKTIETFSGKIADGKLSGVFFPKNIPFLSISPDTKNVFYLVRSGETTEGISGSANNTNTRVLIESPFGDWLPEWNSDNQITLTTKSSGSVEGYMYTLGTSGNFGKLLEKIPGLTTTTSKNNRYVLYSKTIAGMSNLFVFDTQAKKTSDLHIKTLPEKCVWKANNTELFCGVPKSIPNGLFPDVWYQGSVSFEDSLWEIDVVTQTNQLVDDLGGNRIDLIKPTLSDGESILSFVNKKDQTPYIYRLK